MSDKLARMIEALTALMLSLYTPAFAADSVKINDLVVAAHDRNAHEMDNFGLIEPRAQG